MSERHGGVVMRGNGVTVRYKPANRRGDLRPGSKNRAMDDFLMSDKVQDVAIDAAEDIAREASVLSLEEGSVKTGDYAHSFDVRETTPIVADGNPRRTALVENDDPAAVPLEFGNSKVAARRYLGRAGEKYHTPKGIA